ncbi:hypothetical protein [Luteibacter sp. 9135]|uniref:hypothetical protein n=1 Tax=Luteibacter sp. 9135 TaxID=1500893 RepID=UPI00163AB545|nr:hypothetical protein [Luteibacter sp. 9135]
MKKTRYPGPGRPAGYAGCVHPSGADLAGILGGMQERLGRLDERTASMSVLLDRMMQCQDANGARLAAAEVRTEQRFSEVEQRFADAEARSEQRVIASEARSDQRLAATEARLVKRLDASDEHATAETARLGLRLDGVETRLEQLIAWKHRVVGAVVAAGVAGGVASVVADAAFRLLGISR